MLWLNMQLFGEEAPMAEAGAPEEGGLSPEAARALLEDAGVVPPEGEDPLAVLRQYMKGQVEERNSADARLERFQAENRELHSRLLLLERGVAPGEAEDCLALAALRQKKGAKSLEEALDQLLAERPGLLRTSPPPSFAAKTEPAAGGCDYARRHGKALVEGNTRAAIAIKREAFRRGIVI